MRTLKLNEDSSKLANEVISNLKASPSLELFKCIQCGMCASLCPGARYSDYNPREMVKRVLDGDESVVSDDNIWNCFYCYTCHSVCPANNSASVVNQILRQMAINGGETNRETFCIFNLWRQFSGDRNRLNPSSLFRCTGQ